MLSTIFPRLPGARAHVSPHSVSHARAALRRLHVALLLLAVLLAGAPTAQAAPQRLVSLAPSITEMVHALGLTGRLVGVSRFCDYPPAVAELPDVGGFSDPAYETMVRLEPDLVLLLDTHEKAIAELGKLGIETLALPHQTIADIHVALRQIGTACGEARKAGAVIDALEARTAAVGLRVAQTAPPSVLLVINRDVASAQLNGIYVAGRAGFYDELLALANAHNAYTGTAIAYPQLGPESLIALDPDVIIDVLAEPPPGDLTRAGVRAQWDTLRVLRAVREDAVHVLVGAEAMRPGPRYADFLEALARLLHPDAWANTADE